MNGTEKKKLCLIDGSGYIYRAFYAIPPMSRPGDMVPINAVYGFTTMLMQFVREDEAECLAVVFDAQRHNFRNDIYPEYKATRKEVPPELIPQFSIIREAVKAFNVASVEQEGYEADDLIASYTREALEQGYEVIIVSADKDLMQLMRENVHIYDPLKKKMLDETDVEKKFGVSPDKVTDVQALAGDSTDNIPGVNGIGIKTASELIHRYGTLEKLMAAAETIPQERRRKLLLEGRESAFLSKKLVTLDDHAPLPKPIEAFCSHEPDAEEIRAFLEKNTFKSLLNRMGGFISRRAAHVHGMQHGQMETHYECIQKTEDLLRWVEKIKQAGRFAFDTETDSLNPLEAEIAGISLCVKAGEACYIPLNHRHLSDQRKEKNPVDLFNYTEKKAPEIKIPQVSYEDIRTHLLPLFADPQIMKIGHNIKYDIEVLKNNFGQQVRVDPVEDTMVISYDLDGVTHGRSLDELASIFLHHKTISYEEVCGRARNQILFKYVELDKAVPYAAEDADMTFRLYEIMRPKLVEGNVLSVYEDIDRPLIQVLMRMEERGILVDKHTLLMLSQNFATKIAALEKDIYALAGEVFTINSPMKLGEILFEKMKIEGGKKNAKTQNWITDQEVMESLAAEGMELPQKILDYRQYSKLKTTYADALVELINPKTQRVHTTFAQAMTATGRLASNNPNLQNIPIRTEAGRQIRSAFVASPGHVLLSADYSQVELRLIADVADVKGLKEAFAQGLDIHAATASQVFGISMNEMDPMVRRNAKAINFGIIYGISAFGLARQLNISRTDAKQYIDSYMKRYPEIKEYMDRTVEFAKVHSYVLTPFGRKCFINGFENGSTRGFATRAAINAPIQGGAADIIKMAMNKMEDALAAEGLHSKMLLQVHDELVFDTPEDEVEKTARVVKDVMENIVQLSVPLVVEVGTGHNWTEAH